MMASYLPMTLSGDTLGDRHRYLNAQVHNAASSQVSFQDIEAVPEQSPVDRLFKIQLAIQLKNLDYVLKNIKDDDMLYVSKALKCKWLLERRDIINPKYLEEVLFPEMVMPAISKMKHWLYINITDPIVCQEFYEHYKQTEFHFAVKFLNRCNDPFVLKELPKIMRQITPHYLKIFAEKNPQLVKLYYDTLATDNELVKIYLKDEEIFYNNIKCVLKSDPAVFLDITEKYHTLRDVNKLSPSATAYIVSCHKSRFMAKPELYTVYLLHLPTVAKLLSVEECKDLVVKLAQANYLNWWFTYKNVEPLVKRVSREERAAFKKRVFVQKDVGDHVKEWPYKLPASPVASDITYEDSHVFHDQEHEPIQVIEQLFYGRRMLKKRKYMGYCSAMADAPEAMMGCPIKSELQKLFDEFRFVGFEGTLHELRGRIRAVSSADRRRDILLVLVSKSGGRAESVRALLEVALALRNEPVHERAAVVRSLIKRASAWRLPQDVWDTVLEYGRGLGLDGNKPEAECREGLHAVVMRQLLVTGDCDAAVRTAFLQDFSTLTEYKLKIVEREKIAAGLQRILLDASTNEDPKVSVERLGQLLDVLEQYHIPLRLSSVVSAVVALAERDSEIARPLLGRLYKAGVGRRELLRQYLTFRHDDAALVNALRHDPEAIKPDWLIQLLADRETRANQFHTKLAVYFSEAGGFAVRLRQSLQQRIAQKPDVNLARPLATLSAEDIQSIWREQDALNDDHKKIAAALRAHMHRARPAPDALALGRREAGMKAVARRAMRCRPGRVLQLVQTILNEGDKRMMRLALMLAQRTNSVTNIFSVAVKIRPLATLRAALLYFRKSGDAADLRIWDIVRPLLVNVDLSARVGLRHVLGKTEWLPQTIKPDYCAILYLNLDKISDKKVDYIRSDLMKCLSGVNDELLDDVVLRMMDNQHKDNPKLYPAVVIRYLMLSKSDQELKIRFQNVGEPFLAKVSTFRELEDDLSREFFTKNLDQIMVSLQYNTAFFDTRYPCCLTVIERVLAWIQQYFPKESHFGKYVHIHSVMLYYKAIRQSIKQKPEVFKDPAKKMSEGVDIVGFTFGRYIVKELAELKSKYFDSIIELYGSAFTDYLNEYFSYRQRERFAAAIIKGILAEEMANETRLAIHILREFRYNIEESKRDEIKNLLLKSEDKQTQFFLHAELN